MCQNIDDFNRGAAFILAALYQAFPVPLALKTGLLDTGGDLDDTERGDRLEARAIVSEAAAVFLMEEGYLRHVSHLNGAGVFTGAVLTAKGLAALNKTSRPEIRRADTLGDSLIRFVKGTATEAARDSIKQSIMAVLS